MDRSIDVIIPCFNGQNYLRRSVESVMIQTLPVTRVIVVNDGSTDSSLDILESMKSIYPKLEIINQENKGLSSARNSGLRVTKSRYIALLDVDDYWAPQKIENQIDLFENDESLIAVASLYYTLSESGKFEVGNAPLWEINSVSLLKKLSFFPGSASSLMYLNNVRTKRITFDENLRYAEDLDFAIALASQGKCAISRTLDVVIQISNTSMQGESVRKPLVPLKSHLYIIEKYRNLITPIEKVFLEIDALWQLFAVSLKNQAIIALVKIPVFRLVSDGLWPRIRFALLFYIAPFVGTIRWLNRKRSLRKFVH